VLEGAREVAAGVVVECEVRVTVGSLRMIAAEDSLLEDDALGLQVDGLEEVAELELD
jgi:hypothetical protein